MICSDGTHPLSTFILSPLGLSLRFVLTEVEWSVQIWCCSTNSKRGRGESERYRFRRLRGCDGRKSSIPLDQSLFQSLMESVSRSIG